MDQQPGKPAGDSLFERRWTKMRYFRIAILMAAIAAIAGPVSAEHYWYRDNNTPDIEVWTNKGYDANYYYGEDVAVFFRADEDCYALVYDIDPSGEVNVLYPRSLGGSSFVRGGEIYRIPDYGDDFRLEISGRSGNEHIFAVASYDYINPPDYMRYVGYDYGDPRYYDDDYFAIEVRGSLDGFVGRLNARICEGPYAVAHTRFIVDSNYRHHQHYRYWDYDPYYVSSVWVGCDYPGAEVWIDGVFIGIGPVLVPRVVVGYHWVWVYYGGYPCYQRYFYVPHDRRYTIDVRIDRHFKDYRYRRDKFHGWVFDQKRYRNEDGFRERAREVRDKNIRTRSLPSKVIRDYADRGVISKDAPVVRKVRSDSNDRDYRKSVERENIRDKSVRPEARDKSVRPEVRDKSVRPEIKDRRDSGRDKPDNVRESRPDNSRKIDRERSVRGRDENDGNVIVPAAPEKPRNPEAEVKQRVEQEQRESKVEKGRSEQPRDNGSDKVEKPRNAGQKERRGNSYDKRQSSSKESSGKSSRPSSGGKERRR